MQTEESYDDLSALFAAQDEDLQSEAFVKKVMQPIKKPSRWRMPLLFGAGGIGIGAALSQLGGLIELVKTKVPDVEVSVEGIQTANLSIDQNSIWIVAGFVIIAGCTAIVAAERN